MLRLKHAIYAIALLLPGAALALPPVEDFVKRASYGTVRISPTGEYLALTVDRGEQDVLTVLRTADLQPVKINILPDNKSIGQFRWISDNRLMFNAVKKMGGYAQPFLLGEWYAVNADGSQATPVIFRGTRGATQRSQAVGSESFSLLDPLLDDPRNVIMQSRFPRSSEGSSTQVVRVDTVTGRRQVLATAPKANCSVSLDADKEPRFAVCSSSRNEAGEFEERTELYRRNGMSWDLINASQSGGKHLWVEHTTPDGKVYAVQSDQNPGAIGTLDTDTGEFSPLFQDDAADISRYLWSTDESALIAVITAAGAPKVTLIDEDHPESLLYQSLAAAFPGKFVHFDSHTADGKQVIVSVFSDTDPGELYLYDQNSGQARFLMRSRDWVDPDMSASIQPFHLKSRDGLDLYGYLTIPNSSDGRNLPLIVNPHGGPIGPRDYWGYNGEAQLFASRGYAVLQVNFRGSGGYGKGFEDAGHMQWGQGIQNDIIDATRWAIEQGHADPERVCIYGGSFGGYSALMAPIREPGMFKCTFGYVGVYDVDMMFNRGDIPRSQMGQRFLRRTHGTDSKVWAENSPAKRAGEVNIPVYLAAGARDERTPPEQTELMNRALIAAGNPPEGMIIQSGEMHGFYDVDNRVKLYTEMLDFFDRHIGGH
ncbi:S9 family peptidase [Luteimonas sp. A277]